MVKILHISCLLSCLLTLAACGQAINTRGATLPPSPGTSNQNPNNNLPASDVNWDGTSMSGTKTLRVIPID